MTNTNTATAPVTAPVTTDQAATAPVSTPQTTQNKDAPENENNSADLYVPEGMPEHYRGTNDRETINNLYKVVDGYRKDQGKAKGIPEKFDDYTIALPEDLASKVLSVGEDGKDPVFESLRSVLFQNNISPDAGVQIAKALYDAVAAVGSAEDTGENGEPLIDADYKGLGGVDKAKPVIDASNAFINGLKSSGKASDKLITELQFMTLHSDGLQAIHDLRVLMGDKSIPANISEYKPDPAEGGLTQATLNQRVADPRYIKGGKQFDQAFYDETTRMFQELYKSEKTA